jgi:hypothetical protein
MDRHTLTKKTRVHFDVSVDIVLCIDRRAFVQMLEKHVCAHDQSSSGDAVGHQSMDLRVHGSAGIYLEELAEPFGFPG